MSSSFSASCTQGEELERVTGLVISETRDTLGDFAGRGQSAAAGAGAKIGLVPGMNVRLAAMLRVVTRSWKENAFPASDSWSFFVLRARRVP